MGAVVPQVKRLFQDAYDEFAVKCSNCLALVASDEVCCHRCNKPLDWGTVKWFLYKYLNWFSIEHLKLYHDHYTVRMNKRSIRLRQKDSNMTFDQINSHVGSLSRRLEVI